MGLGPSLPPAKLARWDSAFFVEVKCIFSTTPEAEIFSKSSWIEIEANGGHWGDRTRSQHDQTRSVSSSHVLRTRTPVRPVTRGTDASGQAPEGQQTQRVDQLQWRIWSRSTEHVRSCVGAYWNRLNADTVASGQFKQRVRSCGQ
jgi:hypothetical protein